MDKKWPDRNPPPRRRLDRPTILAVDDDNSVLEALHLLLDERYRVIEARNGEAAISLALSQEPDLILLDLLMMGMDGFSVLEELRHRRAKAPIVIVSALNTAWTAAAALRRGATDYVTKPFDEDLLIDTIDSALTLANRSTQGQVLEAAAAPRILLIGADLGIASALTVAFRRHTNLLSVRNTAQALRSLGTEKTDVVVVDAWTRPADVAQLLEQPTLKSLGERVLIVAGPSERGLEVSQHWWTVMPGPLRAFPLLEHVTALLADRRRHALLLSPAVAKVIDYVGANVPSVHVRDVGRAAGRSPDYVSRMFQRETGFALKGFIDRVRAEAVRELLLATDEKMDAIAAEVGLRHASHLSRICVKYLGCRPGEFRRAREGLDPSDESSPSMARPYHTWS